jgi:hypothetical protein
MASSAIPINTPDGFERMEGFECRASANHRTDERLAGQIFPHLIATDLFFCLSWN